MVEVKMNKKKIYTILKKNKEGIVIGAITGMVAASYAINQGADLSSVASAGKGLLDTVMSRSAPIEVATYKLYGFFMVFGAAIGGVVDHLLTKLGK